MPLDPQAKHFLDKLAASRVPGFERMPVPLARAAYVGVCALTGPLQPVGRIENRTIPGNIPVRVYTPKGEGPWPALVYFHGGGWVLGSPDTIDGPCRQLTNAARCVVVSVGYRLAPEHKFPIPPEDCYTATRYVIENADEFGVDPNRVAVGGDSAGGNLATVVAILARERGGPKLGFQLLIYPATDSSLSSKSQHEFAKGYGLTRAEIKWFQNHYLPRPEDNLNPHAAPILAKGFNGLPPAWVMTAECDPLRDEGEAYAARLRDAGIRVQTKRYEGMIHGFFQMDRIMDQAKRAIQDAAAVLRAEWDG